MKAKKATKQRAESFLSLYVSKRGFDDEFAIANQLKDVGGDIRFTNIHPLTGEVLPSNKRLRNPFIGKDGKEVKFLREKGSGHPYFAPCLDWKCIFADVSVPIVVSEGETRSLAAAKHDIPCVGCGGIDGTFKRDTHRTALHSAFDRMQFKKGRKRRIVYLAYDCDAERPNTQLNDSEHAAAKLFHAQGANVHIIRIPRITREGKSGLDDLLALEGGVFIFRALCKSALPWSGSQSNGTELVMLRGDQIEDKKIEYLWDRRIPLGMLTGLCGNPSDGKTWIALNIAANGSRGIQPYTENNCTPFNTVHWSVEAMPETLRRRYKAMNGDLKRLYVLTGAKGQDGRRVGLTLSDIPIIERAVKVAKAKLLVIDPLQSFLGAKVDMHRANETRPLLDELALLAARLNIAVIVIRHLSKANGARSVVRALGSVDITGAMRTEYMVGTAPEDMKNRALVHSKPGELQMTESLRFDIEGKDSHARLIWKGTSQLTASDLSAPEGARRKTKIDQAIEFLWAELAGGPRQLTDIKKASPYSYDTLQEAARRIGVVQSGRKDKQERIWALSELKWAKSSPDRVRV